MLILDVFLIYFLDCYPSIILTYQFNLNIITTILQIIKFNYINFNIIILINVKIELNEPVLEIN